MASGSSTYWSNHLLDLILGAVAFSAPATIFAAVFTATPGAGGGGTEATGGGYVRVGLTNNLTSFPAASAGVKSNGAAFSWAAATAPGWSTGATNMAGAALFDAVSSGNELYFGDLTTPKPVANGDTAQFAIGALSVTVT
jgi:hypothetical protein